MYPNGYVEDFFELLSFGIIMLLLVMFFIGYFHYVYTTPYCPIYNPFGYRVENRRYVFNDYSMANNKQTESDSYGTTSRR